MTHFKIKAALSILLILVFTSCNPKQQKTSGAVKAVDTVAILKQGDSITNRVQKLLLSNVMTAMKAGGPVNAVSFCNIHAMPLTDSLAGEYKCVIQRVTDKYRNTANKLTEADSDIFVKIGSSNPMKPVLVSENGQIVYYKPIKIAMPACLSCHGSTGKEIELKTLEIITQKYPNDMATGYKEGDLRGLWKITFLSE